MKKFISQNSNNKIRIANCIYFLIFAFAIFLFGMLLLNLHTPSNDLKNSVFALTSGDYTYVVDEGDNTKVKITAYTGTSATLVVPSTLEDKTVNEIGDEAFANNNSLVNVTIPNSVTKIGSSIFAGCKNLESITIPFMGDQNYQTVQTSEDEGIWEDEDWLEEYYNRTAYYWFEHVIEETLESDEDYLTLLNDGSNIQGYIPKNLTTLTLTNCKTINYEAFYEADGGFPFTTINLPNTLEIIGSISLSFMENLQNITIPNSVVSIYDSAFLCCSGLTSITIPDSVINIFDSAFGNCSNITSIVIGNSVTSIGNNAFVNCSNLTTVRCLVSVPPTLGGGVFEYCDLTTIQVYEDVVGAYQNSAWGELGATIVGIPRSAFPDTGVGVDIVLPSAIILTLTISIVFVAFGGKKRIIVKK